MSVSRTGEEPVVISRIAVPPLVDSSGATRNAVVSERFNLIGDTVLGGQRGFW
jgi:hypothetical protein